jgi:hypothetical protein
VEYKISDENGIAKSGRIVYLIKQKPSNGSGGTPQDMVVHTQALQPNEIKPGKSHVTSKWDGTITEGPQDSVGQKIVGLSTYVWVRVEVWNRATAAPGKPVGGGQTDVPGEYLSSKEASARIGLIAEARWDNYRCIPFGDPTEPGLGTTGLRIKLKGVRPGLPVHIAVCRIGDIADPSTDDLYTHSPTDQELRERDHRRLQMGLKGATVQSGGRVLLAGGHEPYVEWKHYAEHWKRAGENNFYCFKIALGKNGPYLQASERDYKAKRKECVHMRFTVFIHDPEPPKKKRSKLAEQLETFFHKETENYRAYRLEGSAPSIDRYYRLFRHRYIVIHLGHSLAGCVHPKHPKKADGTPKAVTLLGFAADQDTCPPPDLNMRGQLYADVPDKKVSIETHNLMQLATRDGCNHKEEMGQFMLVGTIGGRWMFLGTFPDSIGTKGLHLWRLSKKPSCETGVFVPENHPAKTEHKAVPDEDLPRLLMYAGGCRTMITNRLAADFTKGGTRYVSGWEWACRADHETQLSMALFREWIKGTPEDPAQTEHDVDRLVQTFLRVAKPPGLALHLPRITDSSGTLSPQGPSTTGNGPGAREESLA